MSPEGLCYLPSWLDHARQGELANLIDLAPWRGDLSRRTQHYGYVYDYKARSVDRSAYLGPLPRFLAPLAAQLVEEGLVPVVPDQAIVNEYEPGQGIADHIDCTPCFGDIIVSLSLLSTTVMTLKRRTQQVPLLLEPGSLLVLKGEARYEWTHGIAKRKADLWHGMRLSRGRRVSVTFRKVMISERH